MTLDSPLVSSQFRAMTQAPVTRNQVPQNVVPVQIDRYSEREMLLKFNTGEAFAVPFFEIRFVCPCASCVDENTGKRILKREDVAQDVRPTGVSLVGRYAVQIQWSDLHSTGMYAFDQLWLIAKNTGKALSL
jgi:DUF971 family protein